MTNSKGNESRRLGTPDRSRFWFSSPFFETFAGGLSLRERARARRKGHEGAARKNRKRAAEGTGGTAGRKRDGDRKRGRCSSTSARGGKLSNRELWKLFAMPGLWKKGGLPGRRGRRGKKRRRIKEEGWSFSGLERRARWNRKKGRNAQGKSVISFCACGYDISNRLPPSPNPRSRPPHASPFHGPLLLLVFSIPPLRRK